MKLDIFNIYLFTVQNNLVATLDTFCIYKQFGRIYQFFITSFNCLINSSFFSNQFDRCNQYIFNHIYILYVIPNLINFTDIEKYLTFLYHLYINKKKM